MEPFDIDQLFENGLALLEKGNNEEAIACFDAVLEERPDDAAVLLYRSRALNNLKKLYPAIEDLTKCIELDPLNFNALFERALIYMKVQNYPSAIDDLTTVIELVPNYMPAYSARAQAYIDAGKPGKSISDLSTLIEDNPGSAELYLLRGQAFYANNIFDRAILDYSIAIDINPDLAEAYIQRGLASESTGDYSGALKDYSTAVKLMPDSARNRIFLCNAHLKKFEEKQASMHALAALKIEPAGPSTWQAIPIIARTGPHEELLGAMLNLAIANEAEKIEFLRHYDYFKVSIIVVGVPFLLVTIPIETVAIIEKQVRQLCGIDFETDSGTFLHTFKDKSYRINMNLALDENGNPKMDLMIR